MRIDGKPVSVAVKHWLDNVRPSMDSPTDLATGRADHIVTEFLTSLGRENDLDDKDQRWVWANICTTAGVMTGTYRTRE